MYKNNLNIITKKNNEFAKKLSEINYFLLEDELECFKSDSDEIILVYQGLALDDIVNPTLEAKNICDENIQKPLNSDDIIVVFGFGSGYLLTHVLNNYNNKVILYEPEPNIFRYAIENMDLSELLSKDNLIIASDAENLIEILGNNFSSNSKIVLLFNGAYNQLFNDELSNCIDKITLLTENFAE